MTSTAESSIPSGQTGRFDATALSGGAAGANALRPLLQAVLAGLTEGTADRDGPLPAATPAQLAETVTAVMSQHGESHLAALRRLTTMLARGSADPADPYCVAHLHCPPLALAVAADLAVSALNPSLDSWDQAPAATTVETCLLQDLAGMVGYPPSAAGVLTSGGTESNLMGLMLARDHLLTAACGRRTELDGLPKEVTPRIFASAAAHFSVQRAAALLGLGENAVVRVAVDSSLRMSPEALRQALQQAVRAGGMPLAVVATAGTTDTGAVDPLHTAADLATAYGAWLHVDAAYGGGALFSERLRPLLDGIAKANSVSLDWHKLGWQPAAAGVFLVRDAADYAPLARNAAYLNPPDDERAGYHSLLGRSLRTTRRADAFKIAVTLRLLGREGLGRLVDACHDLAQYAADAIATHPRLEPHTPPALTTVCFRYLPQHPALRDPAAVDEINASLRRRLLAEGRAVVGRTELPGHGPGRVRLKLTLLNPHSTPDDIDAVLGAVAAAGQDAETQLHAVRLDRPTALEDQHADGCPQ
jgi:L-2,4-diaminobutyrate decarboxylase